MQKNTLILIVGTNGAGKSTLMRAVIQGLGGQTQSCNKNTTVAGAEEVCIIGMYGKSNTNVGCDGLKHSERILAAIQNAKNSYRVVLAEGRYIAVFSNNYLGKYFGGSDKVYLIYLSADENFVRKNIGARGGRYKPHMIEKERAIRTWTKKMREIGALTVELPPSLSLDLKTKCVLNIIYNELK